MKFIEHSGHTHKKRDFPSKGDFSNFNFYKTKEKKKKNKQKAVAWQLEREGMEIAQKLPS